MNKLRQTINKARDFPGLAHIYALEVDRQLLGIGKKFITFSARGFAESSSEIIRTLQLDSIFSSLELSHENNIIHEAELMVKDGNREAAIAYIFSNATGPQINSLNIFYANHTTQSEELRVHYLNKYLQNFGLSIDLTKGNNSTFFNRLISSEKLIKAEGPLVTIIMPAHNAEATIEVSVNSLLNQSWCNLQIIIVDDASTDQTLKKARIIAKRDPRVEVLSNSVNVGPYVSRNLGVKHARGEWLTVHDADDWAFPDRIEQQVKALIKANALTCTGGMLRMNAIGQITRPCRIGPNSYDGYKRLSFVSLMVQTKFFHKELGSWDSVRVAGDAELIDRIKIMGIKTIQLDRPLMICLDHAAGLTRHERLGLLSEDGQVNIIRTAYRKAYSTWHLSDSSKKLEPNRVTRAFEVPEAMLVDRNFINQTTVQHIKNKSCGSAIDLDMSNPKGVLYNANIIAENGDQERAIGLAEKHLPGDLAYTAHVLRANAAISDNNEESWLFHMNAYLAKFEIAPIKLKGEGKIFDRLNGTDLQPVNRGPLISVIMTAWNAKMTVSKAVESILNQTWRNLELLIVDDCSTDETWSVLQQISARDSRVKIMRNKVNVGPYVSKNIALNKVKGEWVTGHDADDWAFPQRLEKQFTYIMNNKNIKAIQFGGLRMCPKTGKAIDIGKVTDTRFDGIVIPISITGFFEMNFLMNKIGYWDSSRFGADSELLYRVKFILENRFQQVYLPCMFYMDMPESLTNNTKTAFNKINGLSPARASYRKAWQDWQKNIMTPANVYCEFPPYKRRFAVPDLASVPLNNILECI